MKKQGKQKDKTAKLKGLFNNMADDQNDKSENDTKVLLDSKQVMKNFLIKMKEEMQTNQ
jgi:hypothetical protein